MVADNDLSSYAIKDINEMESAFIPNGKDKFLIYIDTYASSGLPSHPVLLELVPDKTDLIASKIIYSYPEQNSANEKVFTNILNDAFSYYEEGSITKGLILWSHGNAWFPKNYHLSFDNSNLVKSFGKDQSPQEDTMEIIELAKAIEPYHFEYLLLDACFMASIEVLFELRNSTKFFIASPTEILANGFPYHLIMPYLTDNLNLEKVVQTYYNYYQSQSNIQTSASIVLINSYFLDDLSNLYKKIFINSNNKSISINHLQQYTRNNINLLFDLKQLLLQNEIYVSEIEKLWKNICVLEKHSPNFINLSLSNCNGISTYLFNSNTLLNDYYKSLSWHKASSISLYSYK